MGESKKVGVFSDPAFLLHDTGHGHPERADRLRALEPVFAALPTENYELVKTVEPCDEELLLNVHSARHVEQVRAACAAGPGRLDPDTPVVPASWDAALKAAGATVEACRRVLDGELSRAFCAVRPPGHHAEPGRAMGFCLFNNVAVAAQYLQTERRVQRVAIVDFDVHHGNGSQEAFWDDPSVFYYSSHQFPFYPGSGSRQEVGAGMGLNTTLNSPLPSGAGDEAILPCYEGELSEALRSFKPQFLIVSAGFDAHELDPLAGLRLSTEGFGRVSRVLADLADELCEGRLVSVMEGGYDLRGLADGVASHLTELAR